MISAKDASVDSKIDQKETSPVKKPNFLNKMGAMLGLMSASKFARQDQEASDGRLGSASSYASGNSRAVASRASKARSR